MAHDGLEGLNVPALITSPSDVSRLRREIKALDDYLEQETLRTPGQPSGKLPKTSRLLDELASLNKLSLLDKPTRLHLAAFLEDVSANAPVVNISFSVDPSSAFMQKIVSWFRENIHPSILVRVGLQPNIAAGCVVRTTNEYFDLNLREQIKKHKGDLIAALKAEAT